MRKQVLIDECIKNAPLIYASLKNDFQCSVSHSTAVFGRGVSDKELFHGALLSDYTAIITYDGADTSPTDLSVIANDFYQSVNGYKLTGVIVLPNSNRKGEKAHSVALQTLNERAKEISAYLDSAPKQVLDLRRKRSWQRYRSQRHIQHDMV